MAGLGSTAVQFLFYTLVVLVSGYAYSQQPDLTLLMPVPMVQAVLTDADLCFEAFTAC